MTKHSKCNIIITIMLCKTKPYTPKGVTMKRKREPINLEIIKKEFFLSGKKYELESKVKCFLQKNKSFSIELSGEQLIAITKFWYKGKTLGFKEVNMQTTKSSKRANSLIKFARVNGGKVYYSCLSKNKLAVLIPIRKDEKGKCFRGKSYYKLIVL